MALTHTTQSLEVTINRLVADRADDLIRVRHHLHRNPELSNREVKTAALVADRLHSSALDEVRTGIAAHGLVRLLRGGQPGDGVIALRADMDALPVREESGVEFASTVVDETYPGAPRGACLWARLPYRSRAHQHRRPRTGQGPAARR